MLKSVDHNVVSGYDQLVMTMNDILAFHDILDGLDFNAPIWKFQVNKNSEINLDFSIFELEEFQTVFLHDVVFDGRAIQINNIELAKIIFLEHLEGSGKINYYHLNGLKFISKIFAFLKREGLQAIDNESLYDFYCFALKYKIEGKEITESFSPPGYQSLRGSALSLSDLDRVIRSFDVGDFLDVISSEREQSALNKACLDLFNFTSAEYKEGESFNFLGLDVGRHYIDHCGNLFEDKFQYATSARETLEMVTIEVKETLSMGSVESIQPIVAHALLGEKQTELSKYILSIWAEEKITFIYEKTLAVFRTRYNLNAELASAFRLETINKIIAESKIPDRFDSQEFVRSILFSEIIRKDIKPTNDIFNEYFASLRKAEEAPIIDSCQFLDLCRNVVKAESSLLPNSTKDVRLFCKYNALRVCVKDEHAGVRKLKNGINLVASAGATLVLGMLGWRRSELGFSLKNINIRRNEDVLDNLYTPFRFEVKWFVPKASSNTKIDREISSYSFIILNMLDKVNLSFGHRPAMYFASKARKKDIEKIGDSYRYMSRIVEAAWVDFIQNYALFDGSDNNESINNGLNEIISRLKTDIDIYLLCKTDNRSSFRDKLVQYSADKLDSKQTRILDNSLPHKMLELIKRDSAKLSAKDITKIRNILLQDVAYPTPHGFRHIWAEAVLRRYRGDIGKFIRANFKHLDESFFMAYLRDKETKAIHGIAERTVINSIVRHQIQNLTENEHAFTGGFDRFLHKAVAITKVVSTEEFEKLCNKIANERIISIKANPWNTCMLRVGSEKSAKCAIDGVPQPQQAEPKFCLGCINGNISEGNYNGIVVYIQPDIKACRNENLPLFIKSFHKTVVKTALNRIKELSRKKGRNSYSPFIAYLEETLKLADIGL
jgi:hypothetical protein